MNDVVDQRLYRLALEQAQDYAMFLLSPDGRVLTWGEGARRIKGYRADEIIGRSIVVFYPAEAIESGWPAHELKTAAIEGRFEDEGWRIRKDGSRFWANVAITALRDEQGTLLGFLKLTRDLTDRRMHDEALRQTEERFRLLVDGVLDYAIYMLDPTGVVTSWNKGAERIKGYGRDEIIGRNFSCFFSGEDVQAGKPQTELATAREMGRAEEEGWRLRKNGERFWARVVVTPLHDADGRLRGFAKVTQDLTDRLQIKNLEQAARNVSAFLAMLTHELRNPLAPIRMAAQILTKNPNVDQDLRAVHQTIDRQSAHLTRLLDDMMDVSRMAQGKFLVKLSAVDLAEVARRAAETSKPLISGGNHTFTMDLPEEGLFVEGDFDRLTQLLSNILNNAARYTPRGGQITLTGHTENEMAVIRVLDTGRGIGSDQIERIFNMFTQGQPSNDQVDNGLGVGLALARNIAELHNGSLKAFSEGENQGSEFVLKVPSSAIRAIPLEREVPLKNSNIPQRILIVDDNIDAATTLNLFLQSLGHTTCVVYDGETAIELAKQFSPTLILLDLGIPGIDGYETARLLRTHVDGESFRIIAVTGWGSEADRQKTRSAGFDLHLVKPVDLQELVTAMNNEELPVPDRI